MLFVETLLFGGFMVLYPISVWILLYRERRKRQSRMGVWMFATVTVMFILALVVRRHSRYQRGPRDRFVLILV